MIPTDSNKFHPFLVSISENFFVYSKKVRGFYYTKSKELKNISTCYFWSIDKNQTATLWRVCGLIYDFNKPSQNIYLGAENNPNASTSAIKSQRNPRIDLPQQQLIFIKTEPLGNYYNNDSCYNQGTNLYLYTSIIKESMKKTKILKLNYRKIALQE